MLTVSVIIPTKDRREYLLDMLNDLNRQSYPVLEVISSDQSKQFKPIQATFKYNLIHFPHAGKGPCISRNDAAEKASADILVFLDDDARIKENFIEEIIKPIVNKVAPVCSGAICDITGNISTKSHISDFWFYKLTAIPNNNYSDDCRYTPGGCFAIDKNVFFKIGKFDLFFDPNGAGEDREIAIRLSKSGYKIHFNGNAKLLHARAPSGGRRERGSSSIHLIKNVGYIIYKYYGNKELNRYRKYLVKKRLERIFRLDLPRYNLKMIFHLLKITSKKRYE